MEIGLALSGGGIKGAAHIGAIKALEDLNFKIKYISGSSSGSIVAILYAMGYKTEEILNIFKKYEEEINYIEIKNILKLILGIIFKGEITINGFNSGEKIEKLINKFAQKKQINNIKNIKKPFLIPAVNINNGEIINFTNIKIKNLNNEKFYFDANPGKVVRASCSFPAVFEPCNFDNMQLSDGAIREKVPWKGLKLIGSTNTFAITFKEEKEGKKCKNIIDVLLKSVEILGQELNLYEMEGVDKEIEIITKNIGLLEKNKTSFLYNLGYSTTYKKIEKIN